MTDETTIVEALLDSYGLIVPEIVLGLVAWQWMMLLSSLFLLFVAELLNQALKSMAQAFGEALPPPVQKALGMSTAASMLALVGVLLVAGFTLSQRMSELFAA